MHVLLIYISPPWDTQERNVFEKPGDEYLKKKRKNHIVFCFCFLIKKNKCNCFNFKKMFKAFQ